METDYELESIKTYYYYKTLHSDNTFTIDETTWDDLDMDKVFKRINVCLTSVGEEYLYDCLHSPQYEETKLLEREAFINFLQKQPDERFKLQIYLAKLGKVNFNGLSSLIYNAQGNLLKYPFIYKILSVIPILCIIMMYINVNAGIGCLVLSFIINMIVYYMTKRKIEPTLPAIKYFSSILWCCNKLRKIENFKTEPYYVQLKKLYNNFKPLAGKIPNMKVPVTDIDFLIEYIKILFLLDIKNYNKIIHGIIKHLDEFHNLYKIVGEIDLSICIFSFRESMPFYSTPQFHSEKHINFDEIYHPLLTSPVPNSGKILSNSIITGSNASGKSTFIKALAVNGILAQTIYTCLAKKFTSRFSLVITSMAVRDNISEGESYFITEIKSLKRILDKIQIIPCTCYIDEILRGTNTIERIAASASVLKYLNNMDCLCVVASHDIELTYILQNIYDNYHFCEQITDDGMLFDYKLKHGVSQTKNAVKLLQYMGFDKLIIENAITLVSDFEVTN